MIGADLFSILAGNAGVATLAGDRIFPGVMPQGSGLPAVVYTAVDDVPENTLEDFTLSNARVQVDCYAKGYVAAQTLAKAIVDVLSGYRVGGMSLLLLAKRDGYEDETQYHRVSMDFSMWLGR